MVQANADRFAKISRISGTGGNVVLAAATMGMACYKIGQTKDRQEQNEILVESVGGIVGGVAAGCLALALFGGPIGIGAALFLAGASTVGGMLTGAGFKSLYQSHSTSGKPIDFVKMTGTDRLCGPK